MQRRKRSGKPSVVKNLLPLFLQCANEPDQGFHSLEEEEEEEDTESDWETEEDWETGEEDETEEEHSIATNGTAWHSESLRSPPADASAANFDFLPIRRALRFNFGWEEELEAAFAPREPRRRRSIIREGDLKLIPGKRWPYVNNRQ